ncbi:ABC transporter permease [candidate division KSB1 bacterium]
MKKNNIKIPKTALFILRRLLPGYLDDSFLNDYEYLYSRNVLDKGFTAARLWLWGYVLKSSLRLVYESIRWSLIMFKNYMKTALRHFAGQKVFSFINVTGLAVGLAVSFVILLYVYNEFGYDRFHRKFDRIYRVTTFDNNQNQRYGGAPYLLGPKISDSIPEIEKAARIMKWIDVMVKTGQNEFISENRFFYADKELFDIFDFPFVYGNPEAALTDMYSIVLTEKMAKKYFGEKNPVGKSIFVRTIIPNSKTIKLNITGVLKDFPSNSHFTADFIAPIEGLSWVYEGKDLGHSRPGYEFWPHKECYTYILSENNINIKEVGEKITGILGEQTGKMKGLNETKSLYLPDYKFELQSLKKIHLYSANFAIDIQRQEDIKNIFLFITIAVSILLIAIINYIILSTARSADRSKEIGLRKVIGANRSNIIFQIMTESLLYVLIALPLSLILVEFLLPEFNRVFRFGLETDYSKNLHYYTGVTSIIVFTALFSGAYISAYLSGLGPMDVFNKFNTSSARSFFRRGLIVFQLTVFVVLTICTTIIFRQVEFAVDSRTLGFEKDNILSIFTNDRGNKGRYIAFKNEIKNSPYIENATVTKCPPPANYSNITYERYKIDPNAKNGIRSLGMGSGWGSKSEINLSGAGTVFELEIYEEINTDHEYLDIMGIKLIEGRALSKESPLNTRSVLVNEAYVKEFGISDPIGFKIGKVIEKRTIIGVVKDFKTRSIYEKTDPLVITLDPYSVGQIIVKVKEGYTSEAIDYLNSKWTELCPGNTFTYSFLDESIERMYGTEKKLGDTIGYFTFLSIFIACLGLFGLSLFTAERRTKEIGIRKVFGASVSRIVMLISKEFFWLVITANIIGWPIAWYVMNRWLQDFVYRINISWVTFVIAGVASVIISIFTVSFQTVKAANTKPVNCLKYE